MVKVVNEHIQTVDSNCYIVIQELSDDSRREIAKHGDKIVSIKTIQKDGSYIKVNGDNIKTEEQTSDGYVRIYNPQTQKLNKEISPQKVVTTFYDNGNKESVQDEKNNTYISYYENGNVEVREIGDYEICLDINGNTNYELKDGRITINPNWFSYYCLGVKSKANENHWDEKATLNPNKKTLLCLGGDQTRDARKANGNGNAFLNVLGLSNEQKENIQVVSCYRPYNSRLRYAWLKAKGFDEQINKDYKREILQKFMPFMARYENGSWERLHPQKLVENFANIMIQSHCAGANDLPRFDKVLRQTMSKLGYGEQLQKQALKQVICITGNSQREMTDDFGFTCIHRYSVKDGQFEPEYDMTQSAEYPVFLQDYPSFEAKKGNRAAFVEVNPSEMIMVFDKILKTGSKSDEHNDAFWTTDDYGLTSVGKYQAHLMTRIGKFWYNNHKELPPVANLIQQVCLKDDFLHQFAMKALAFGKKIKAEKNNVLVNHHILKSAWNKFKNPKRSAPMAGVYKLLSDKYRE